MDNPTADRLRAARAMADSGRPTLARLLAEDAADPTEAARILAQFPGRSMRREV